MKSFLLLCLAILSIEGLPQDKRVIDSLTRVLESKSGGDRYHALYQLAVEYFGKDNLRSLDMIEEAEAAALLSGDTFAIVKSKRAKGQVLFRLGRIEEVFRTYEAIYPVANEKKYMRECMLMSNILGSAYMMQSRIDQALRYHFQAYEIAIDQNDSSGIAMVLNNIGTAYYKLKDYPRGLEYLTRGYEIDQAINDVSFDTPMNISLCYIYLQDFKNARKYLETSLRACGSECPDYAMVHIEYALGCLLLGQKQFDQAERAFLKSYSLAKRTDNFRMQLDNIHLLAEIHFRRNHFTAAIKCLEEGEKIIDKGIPFNLEMIKIYSHLAEYNMAMKRFEKASLYQHKYITLKDSIYNEDLTLKLMRIEAQFLERENKNRIAAQNEVILLKEGIIQRQEILNAATSLVGLLTVAFSIFLYRNYRQKKKFNLLLEAMIRTRTSELEDNSNKLANAGQERFLKMDRAFEAVVTGLNTIQGLCLTGKKENCVPPANAYLSKIEETALDLRSNLKSILAESPLDRIGGIER